MTKRDLFLILIKVFGLYSLILTVFTVLPTTLSFFTYKSFGSSYITLIILSLGIPVTLFILLIQKSDVIVTKLNLEKGFDEDRIDWSNFDDQKIVKLASFLIGGFLFLDNIPPTISYLFYELKYDQMGIDYIPPSNFQFTVNLINIVIGYLLITNYHIVSKIFHKK